MRRDESPHDERSAELPRKLDLQLIADDRPVAASQKQMSVAKAPERSVDQLIHEPPRRLIDDVAKNQRYLERSPPRLEPGHAAFADASVVSEQTKPGPAPHQEGEVGGILEKTEEPVLRRVEGLLESEFHDSDSHSRCHRVFPRRLRSSLNAPFSLRLNPSPHFRQNLPQSRNRAGARTPALQT